jgi:hypothetical protein
VELVLGARTTMGMANSSFRVDCKAIVKVELAASLVRLQVGSPVGVPQNATQARFIYVGLCGLLAFAVPAYITYI